MANNPNKKFDILSNIDLDNKGLMEYKLVQDKKEHRKTIFLAILITFITTVIGTTIFLHFNSNTKAEISGKMSSLQEQIKALEAKLPKEQAEQEKK